MMKHGGSNPLDHPYKCTERIAVMSTGRCSVTVCVHQLMQLFNSPREGESTKIYLKFTLKCSYMFRPMTILHYTLLTHQYRLDTVCCHTNA